MTHTERENFYRNSTLIVDHTNESFTGLLAHDLTKQGYTLLQLIQAKQHEIYHMCYNLRPCCMCPQGSTTPVFRHNNRILYPAQLDILLDSTVKSTGHNPNSRTKHCCCPANPNINYDQLDLTQAACLLVNFTTIVPDGSPERLAVEELIKFRHESYAHATKGLISDNEYQIDKAQIEKFIMILAKAQGRESEFKQKLSDAAVRPLDEAILRQYQTTLMANDKMVQEMLQTLKKIESAVGVNALPDCLTTDLYDIPVTEGCDAIFKIYTRKDEFDVLWLKDGSEIICSEKYIIENAGKFHSLTIINTCLSDQGFYTVKVNNIERQAHLDVKGYFSKNLQSVECIEGEKAEFTCEVIEDSLPALWNRNGICLKSDEKYEILQAGKTHRLSIKYCDLHDTGKYEVSINNRVRATSLNVKEYFIDTLGSKTCTEGETVQFECQVLDDNQTGIWFKDGTEVSTSEKYKVERQGKLHRFVIINSKLDDKGEYSVKIKNCVRRAELVVREMPKAIKQLSKEDIELYMEIIKAGSEIHRYIRIVIIGENGVGKTCLLRRLLRQSTTGVQSTDGVDIHRCTINLSNGQWIFDEESDKKTELLLRLKKAKNSSSGRSITLRTKNPQSNNYVPSFQYRESGGDSFMKEQTCTSLGSSIRERTTHEKSENENVKEKLIIFTQMQNRTDSSEMEEGSSQPRPNIKTKLLNEEVLQVLNDFFSGIEEVDIPSDEFVECGLLDFAGEKEYYATHPIFLNPNAIHLLVANIMKDVKPIKTEDGFDKIGEYLDFWLDSIHCCGVDSEAANTDFLYPPAIIVCTRIDECRDNLEEKKRDFCKQLGSVLRSEAKKKHIREICYVSNTESNEEAFCDLRDTILKYGKQLKTFAEELPLKWIRLEHLIHAFREAGLNILSWSDIVKLSEICSIHSENEINLFLKYQHKVGSVIYFESLKDYIILNQKWLANAFRCLVSDKFNTCLKLSDEWRALEDTGKLENSLIVKLFDKEPELDFSKHRGHLLNLMEIFGIIVKLTTLMDNGERQLLPTYYMPCMISEKASFTDIIALFNAKKDNCQRTPWLCIEFDFLPFDFFNHIMCYYISHYAMCPEPQTGRMAIYHGMGVFFLDSSGFRKFILCFCKNTIALQIWQWKTMEKGNFKTMLEELKLTTEKVKEKFETRRVSYTVKLKCSDGNIHISAGRHSYHELVKLGDEYFCEEHSDSHKLQDFSQTWLEDYTENQDCVPSQLTLKDQTGVQKTKFEKKCTVCYKESSVYYCCDCQISMCKDCCNQHRKSDFTSHHTIRHEQDLYVLFG